MISGVAIIALVVGIWFILTSQTDTPPEIPSQTAYPIVNQPHPEIQSTIDEPEHQRLLPLSTLTVEKKPTRTLRKPPPHRIEPIAFGRILGMVVDRHGAPVAPAKIEVRSRRFSRKVEVNGIGEFDVRDIPPGEYVVLVSEDSLLPPYVPPFNQEDTAGLPPNSPEGFMATQVSISPMNPVCRIRLRVFSRSTLEGYVRDMEGKALEDITVLFGNVVPGFQRISFNASTDADGYFKFENLGPGRYNIQAFVNPSGISDHPASQLSPPQPFEMDIEEGQDYTLKPLVFGSGMVYLRGNVFDQYGQPFAGLKVLVYLNAGDRPDWSKSIAHGTTDTFGAYFVGPFPAESVLVQIAPMGCLPGRTDNLLKNYLQPFPLDLRRKVGTADAPVQVAERNEIFELEGELVSLSGELGKGLRVEIYNKKTFESIQLRIARDSGGEKAGFSWRIQTPYPDIELRVKKAGVLIHTEALFPKPHGKITNLLVYVP